jgi:hypothetical protein
MYNEPNIGFWKPKPDVKQYVKLAIEVGKALREATPDELYIGPASSTIDMPFLEECFRSGLLEYWSAVSVHPYRESGPETAADEYARLRKMIEQYAPKNKNIPIFSGEWGYTSCNNLDEAAQGKLLPRQWLTNLMCDVPLSIWYDWHDDGQDPKEGEHHFGTVRFPYNESHRPVYEPKPAYLAVQTLIGTLSGFHFLKRLPTESTEDYVLVFAKDEETRWVAWTTSATPHSIRVPLAAGEYRVTGHTGQPLPNLAADAQGLSITLNDAPQYVSFAQSPTK